MKERRETENEWDPHIFISLLVCEKKGKGTGFLF
jgi:hypothetical protein